MNFVEPDLFNRHPISSELTLWPFDHSYEQTKSFLQTELNFTSLRTLRYLVSVTLDWVDGEI